MSDVKKIEKFRLGDEPARLPVDSFEGPSEKEGNRKEPPGPLQGMKRQRIMIVDDEEVNIRLLKAMLMGEHYHILGLMSGREALELVPEMMPDLILLDVMMPGIDGFEVCERLKSNGMTKMIPVVMVTALRDREHRIKAMESGADDFLAKPVDKTELLLRMKSLLRIKTYHDELRESYGEIAQKNEKLKELEKVKEGLTHMIIHDLNNPLVAISGTLELLLLEKEVFSPRHKSAMEKCLNYCDDLQHQIQGLLDVHRMEETRIKPARKMTDVSMLVEDLLGQFKTKARLKGISLVYHKNGDIPCVKMDGDLIKRVIANLLNNGVRHSPVGGHMELKAGSDPHKRCLMFDVRDSGRGLAPEYHARIFNKFEQVELKEAGVFTGSSGLGLAFCKLAVEAHDGRIWVESQGEGKGCTFKFVIPIS